MHTELDCIKMGEVVVLGATERRARRAKLIPAISTISASAEVFLKKYLMKYAIIRSNGDTSFVPQNAKFRIKSSTYPH